MPCSKKMLGCYALCGQRLKIQDYRDERQRQVDELMESTGGYETEIQERSPGSSSDHTERLSHPDKERRAEMAKVAKKLQIERRGTRPHQLVEELS